VFTNTFFDAQNAHRFGIITKSKSLSWPAHLLPTSCTRMPAERKGDRFQRLHIDQGPTEYGYQPGGVYKATRLVPSPGTLVAAGTRYPAGWLICPYICASPPSASDIAEHLPRLYAAAHVPLFVAADGHHGAALPTPLRLGLFSPVTPNSSSQQQPAQLVPHVGVRCWVERGDLVSLGRPSVRCCCCCCCCCASNLPVVCWVWTAV
jgi:hypothetical protein